MRYVVAAVAIVLSASLAAQNPAAEPRFEVVSIKRDTSGSRALLFGTIKGVAFSVEGATAAALIRQAHPAEDRNITGLPDWAKSDRYVIVGKAGGTPTREELMSMLAAMLADRFQLAMHYDRHEGRIYALVVADRSGKPKAALRSTSIDCTAIGQANERGEPVPETANGAPPCGLRYSGGILDAGGIDMAALAENLSPVAGRPVFDRTNLEGNFEFTLRYSAGAPRPDGNVTDTASVFTALPEQLGLKLEPQDGALRSIVIDHIERPTEN